MNISTPGVRKFQIREKKVPEAHTENQRIDRLIDLESVATLEGSSSGRILLASNPFVLRWFSSYLNTTRMDLVILRLSEKLVLSSGIKCFKFLQMARGVL